MRTIVVDDEQWSISQMKKELEGSRQVELVGCFEDSREALSFARESRVDFAILDIEMPYMNGIELGRELKKVNPQVILIYLTGYDSYLKEAMLDLKADYYVLKPYSHQDIEDLVKRAGQLSARFEKQVYISCFGGFELYIDGKLIHFANRKAKELLALCVHMEGKHVTMEKAVDTLWEEHPYDSSVKSLYRKSVIYINAVFRDVGVSCVFENGRGYCNINREKIRCDYYEYLSGKLQCEDYNKSMEYLPEYSWAEGTLWNYGF